MVTGSQNSPVLPHIHTADESQVDMAVTLILVGASPDFHQDLWKGNLGLGPQNTGLKNCILGFLGLGLLSPHTSENHWLTA